MATAQERYLRRARRYLTKAEQAEFAERVRHADGMFCTRRVRPRVWTTLGKTLALLGLAAFLALMIVSGSATDSITQLTGGIPGKVTVLDCESSGRSQTCYGTFVGNDRRNPIVIDNAVIEGGGVTGLPDGQTFAARVGSADSTHVYLSGWNPVMLIPLALTVGIVLGLLHLLCVWPLRAAIHLWRPDVWPYWIGNPFADRARNGRPRMVRLAIWVEAVVFLLIFGAFALAVLDAIAGTYGTIGVVVVVAGLSGFGALRRRRRRRRVMRKKEQVAVTHWQGVSPDDPGLAALRRLAAQPAAEAAETARLCAEFAEFADRQAAAAEHQDATTRATWWRERAGIWRNLPRVTGGEQGARFVAQEMISDFTASQSTRPVGGRRTSRRTKDGKPKQRP